MSTQEREKNNRGKSEPMQTLPHIHSSQAAKVWKSAARASKAKPLPTDLQEPNLEEQLMNKNQIMFPIWRSATLDRDQNA
jgi:hypothetical protein